MYVVTVYIYMYVCIHVHNYIYTYKCVKGCIFYMYEHICVYSYECTHTCTAIFEGREDDSDQFNQQFAAVLLISSAKGSGKIFLKGMCHDIRAILICIT